MQHNKRPFKAAEIANGMPLTRIHIILAMVEIPPPLYCTSLPNGKKAREANLKHCMPMGIPIIVIHHKTPQKNQLKP